MSGDKDALLDQILCAGFSETFSTKALTLGLACSFPHCPILARIRPSQLGQHPDPLHLITLHNPEPHAAPSPSSCLTTRLSLGRILLVSLLESLLRRHFFIVAVDTQSNPFIIGWQRDQMMVRLVVLQSWALLMADFSVTAEVGL